jgi:integrative and conjugative element protein (TIGR02256 family)
MKTNIIIIKRVIITEAVMRIFEGFKQYNKKDNESGGVLLGQIIDDKIYILKASTPNKFDKASRFSFECNKDAAQVIIDYEFINSENKTIYLGEWHTHPEDYPNPSGIDIRMIKNQYFKNKLNEPFLILLIQGRKEIYIAKFDGNKIESIEYGISK